MMRLQTLMSWTAMGLLAACTAAETPKPESAAVEKAAPVEESATSDAVDYTALDSWLCHPDKAGADACAVDLTTTRVFAGTDAPLTEIEPFTPAAEPDFDCFYVYPTVSIDPGGNSDLTPDAPELAVVKGQFARFGEVCRLFAPIYRQVTLAGLNATMAGKDIGVDNDMGVRDVRNAWNDYLEHHNHGRGVVLIGHSQGANVIQELLKTDILGQPAEDQLISAMPLGIPYTVDRETGLFHGSMAQCRSKDQTGCLINFSAFRVDSPPPPTSFFGRSMDPTQQAACVNPSDLTGHDTLNGYLTNGPNPLGATPDWAGEAAEVTTPFVAVPGLLSGECVEAGPHNYLAITTHGDPEDPRTDRVDGDVYIMGQAARDWGLHLGDVHYVIGDLIEIADAQAKAWEAKQE